MGFYISYKKDGKTVNENFGSYYLAICRKEKLRKNNIKAEIKEKLSYAVKKTTNSSVASKAEKEIAEEIYKKNTVSLELRKKYGVKTRDIVE